MRTRTNIRSELDPLKAYPADPCVTGFRPAAPVFNRRRQCSTGGAGVQPVKRTGCKPVPHLFGIGCEESPKAELPAYRTLSHDPIGLSPARQGCSLRLRHGLYPPQHKTRATIGRDSVTGLAGSVRETPFHPPCGGLVPGLFPISTPVSLRTPPDRSSCLRCRRSCRPVV